MGDETYTNDGQALYCSLACLQAQPEDKPEEADQGLVLWPSTDAWAKTIKALDEIRWGIFAYLGGVAVGILVDIILTVIAFLISILILGYYHEFTQTD